MIAEAHPSRRVLIVDRNPVIHEEFTRIFTEAPYGEPSSAVDAPTGSFGSYAGPGTDWHLEHAYQGTEAVEKAQLTMIQGAWFDLAFVDIRLPSEDRGLEAIEQLWHIDPDLEIVICTASSEFTWQEIDAHLGRPHQVLILKKPFDAAEVAQMASTLSEKRHLKRLQDEHTRDLENQVRTRTAALMRAYEETIHLLVRASVHRDTETGNHIKRVGLYSARLAMAVGLDQEEVDLIRLAAPMHDVGKIGIPDSVLRKPGPLTPEERQVMETHTTIGADMLAGSESPVLRKAREIALSHHERWDGQGYPQGLKGEDIPLSARIVAVADVYDALTQNRVYRKAMSEERVVKILKESRGTHFDPRLVDLALSLRRDFQLIAAVHPDEEPEAEPADGTAGDSNSVALARVPAT